jgi:hypothetical protein
LPWFSHAGSQKPSPHAHWPVHSRVAASHTPSMQLTQLSPSWPHACWVSPGTQTSF